jgi:hypothetical protein
VSEILESAKSHFREKLGGGLKSIEVPEWSVDGKPAMVYYKPSLNFLQQEKILALSDQNKKAEAIVEALIQRALDADGNKLFKSVNRQELMRMVDPDVISRIVGEMSGDETDGDEAEKN